MKPKDETSMKSKMKTIVIRNCVYLGAEIDATRTVGEVWKTASRVPGPCGAIVPRTAPPVAYTGTAKGQSVRTLADGSYVIDFGENLSGVPVFEFRDEPRGNRIEIVYGERMMASEHPSGIVPKCIGDHEALERAPDEVTATAHYHEFVRLTAGFARATGREADAREFESLADQVKAAFQREYVKGGVVANGTQSAQSIGLYLGLVDDVPAAEVMFGSVDEWILKHGRRGGKL